MTSTKSSDALQPTLDGPSGLQSTPSPGRPGDSSRPKVGFVEGTRPHFSDETASLLRSRLQAATFVLSVIMALTFVRSLFVPNIPLVGLRAAILAGFVGSFFALRSRREFSLLGLQYFEAGLFGILAVQLLLMMHSELVTFAEAGESASVVAVERVFLAVWSILILTYAIFIPNTWKRATAVLIPAAALPYLLLFWLRWQSPEVAKALDAEKLGTPIPMPFVAVFIAWTPGATSIRSGQSPTTLSPGGRPSRGATLSKSSWLMLAIRWSRPPRSTLRSPRTSKW